MKRNQKPARSISVSTTPAPPAPPETPAVSALSRFTEATIIIALITFFGYWGAFSYEEAYFTYFNIPYSFISLNPTVVFFTSAGWIVVAPLIAFLLIWFAVMNALEPVGKRIERRFPRSVKICGISFAILMLGFLAYKLITDQELRNFWTVENLVIVAAIFALGFLLRLFYRRYKENKEETPWGLIALFVSCFFLALYIEFRFLRLVAREIAKKQEVFHVYVLPPPTSEVAGTPNSPTTEVAVIRQSGDYLLTVPFTRDPKWAVFENKLILVKMSDSKTPLSLSLEKIGPLHKPGTTPAQP
jgi:hypothetical protein